MKFQHLIISRFNLDLYTSKSEKEAAAWMDYRLKIFDTFCYPSIVGQTNQNFTWLILFDAKTPKYHRQIIAKYKRITPIYYIRNPQHSLQDIVMKTIKHSRNPDAEYIITTRIDVDDMISSNFIQQIQLLIPKEDNVQLVFSLGYVLQIHPNILMERDYTYNQFPSYIEKNTKDIKTVWFTAHGHIHKTSKTTIITEGRMWCWTLHKHHLGKYSKIKYYKYPIVDSKILKKQFIFKGEVK